MTPLFLHHDGTRAEVLLSRALVQALCARGADVMVGCCRGDAELFAGLPVPVVEGPCRNTPFGAPIDLAGLAPSGREVVSIWLGGDGPVATWQWADVVAWFSELVERRGLAAPLPDHRTVPMLDFAGEVLVPALARRSIWLDTRRSRDPNSWFLFDVERLLRALPEHDFVCPAPPFVHPRIVDASSWSMAQQSRASEGCELLVGATADPFVLTLTEANRHKPKALCGHDARTTAPVWDYPLNPLELLATMDDLVDFLLANVALEVPA